MRVSGTTCSYLVGGLEHFLFPYIRKFIIPIDELIFFRRVGIQPTSNSGYITIVLWMIWQLIRRLCLHCFIHLFSPELHPWDHPTEEQAIFWVVTSSRPQNVVKKSRIYQLLVESFIKGEITRFTL